MAPKIADHLCHHGLVLPDGLDDRLTVTYVDVGQGCAYLRDFDLERAERDGGPGVTSPMISIKDQNG